MNRNESIARKIKLYKLNTLRSKWNIAVVQQNIKQYYCYKDSYGCQFSVITQTGCDKSKAFVKSVTNFS